MPSGAEACRSVRSWPSSDASALADLMDLPGVQGVTVLSDGVSVTFPEADFVIFLSSRRAGTSCETEWEVIVREPTPGLSTWWGRWHRTFSVHRSAVGPLIAEELRGALARVKDMLDDHAVGSDEMTLQDA